VGVPKALVIIEPLGSPRLVIIGALEDTRGSLAPISLVFDS
jgi:hypothetical protein